MGAAVMVGAAEDGDADAGGGGEGMRMWWRWLRRWEVEGRKGALISVHGSLVGLSRSRLTWVEHKPATGH